VSCATGFDAWDPAGCNQIGIRGTAGVETLRRMWPKGLRAHLAMAAGGLSEISLRFLRSQRARKRLRPNGPTALTSGETDRSTAGPRSGQRNFTSCRSNVPAEEAWRGQVARGWGDGTLFPRRLPGMSARNIPANPERSIPSAGPVSDIPWRNATKAPKRGYGGDSDQLSWAFCPVLDHNRSGDGPGLSHRLPEPSLCLR